MGAREFIKNWVLEFWPSGLGCGLGALRAGGGRLGVINLAWEIRSFLSSVFNIDSKKAEVTTSHEGLEYECRNGLYPP